jgi:lysophospholipase L1-like esterase
MIWLVVAAAVLVLAFAGAELACRSRGLHAPLLYERTGYGYRVKPGQQLRRFGNRLAYNRFGMRSDEIADVPAPGVVRVLCIGDSVTYGGAQTDQSDTYPERLGDALRGLGFRAEVLNVSAGGWAPANAAGWLRAHGVYGSAWVVIQLGTHDLFQREASGDSLGVHPQFPDRPPRLGLEELVVRYLLPRVRARLGRNAAAEVADPVPTDADADAVLADVAGMIDRIVEEGARPLVMLTEQLPEAEPGDPVTLRAKARLAHLLEARDVPFYRPAHDMRAAGAGRLFRDAVHPNAAGNHVIAQGLARTLERHLRADLPAARSASAG